MVNRGLSISAWPEDPAWPDPFGNDPYDIFSQ
jgi:hypothetical protein